MKANPLTDCQREVYYAICNFYAGRGVPPTIRELKLLCSVTSTNQMRDHLEMLIDAGYLKRMTFMRGHVPNFDVCPMCRGNGRVMRNGRPEGTGDDE